MVEEYVDVGLYYVSPFSGRDRNGNVGMHVQKVVVGVELIDVMAVGGHKHQIHDRIFQLGIQLLCEFVALTCHHLQIVFDDPSTHKSFVDEFDYSWVGEQTCPQVGSARSTTLVI